MTNPHAIGIEAEGAMEDWPAAQYAAYVRLVAALLDEFGLANGRALRHAETCSPAGRKIDASFSGPAFRRAVANVKPGTTPAPTPEEGLFGMAGYENRSRSGDQTVPAAARMRLRTHPKTKTHSGPHYVARPKRKGQKFMLEADVAIHRVPEGADIKGQFVIVYYFKEGGSEITRPFSQTSFPTNINGHSSIKDVQVEQFGGSVVGKKRGSKTVRAVEFQYEIANFSKSPVTVKRIRSTSFYE